MSGRVWSGTLWVSVRRGIAWWVIEIWEDGKPQRVYETQQDRKPTYKDKLGELNGFIARRRDAEADTAKWKEEERRRDEEDANHR